MFPALTDFILALTALQCHSTIMAARVPARVDRHPDHEDLNATTHPEMFETRSRACNACGEIARYLEKEYL